MNYPKAGRRRGKKTPKGNQMLFCLKEKIPILKYPYNGVAVKCMIIK